MSLPARATQPTLLRTCEEAIRFRDALAKEGRTQALVPTMGYLHEGHLTLMREAAKHADVCVTSIFVNPTQFGAREDLARYPRDLEGDLRKCEQAGVAAVFAPSAEEMYPKGFQTTVEVSEFSRGLCGERRPGHFRGVATVVTQLLCLFRPKVALFGEKDFQQLRVIEALARDLHLGASILSVPIVREPDGLALSSRNAYLSAEEREKALALSRGLRAARHLFQNGMDRARELVMAVRQELEAAGVREDYVELVDASTLMPLVEVSAERPARLLVAGFVGNTRLIDNAPIGGEPPPLES